MLDRRRFLGLSAGAAGALVMGRRLGVFDVGTATAASPPVTPFTRALEIPPAAVPVSTSDGVDRYEIELRTATVEILDGLSTEVYGYDGRFPGPTIEARTGRPVEVTFTSALPVPAAIHLHGGNVAPEHDGHPMDVIEPGASRIYRYPNAQLAATLWYHDHAMHRTAENVYRGLAGLYLLRDPDEGLGLPAGGRDIPLLLQDRAFASDGSLSYPAAGDPRRHDGVTGDVFLVNGVPFPRIDVERGRYRFRIINGSNTRTYELRLAGSRSMTQIASDGGLLAAPAAITSLTLGVAERAEVIIDFSSLDGGTSLELQDALSERAIARFDVGASSVTGGAPPATLRSIVALPAAEVTRDLLLTFDESIQQWVINGRPFDHDRIDFRPRLGVTETWRIRNDSTFVHPFHLHLVMFQVRKRGLANPPANERGWKDTIRVAPGETVELAARFTGHTGTYVFHCHVLEHEDHAMMAQLRVVDLPRFAGADRTATAAAVSSASFPAEVDEVLVATGDSFADALAGGPVAAALGAPILLVRGDALSDASRAELERLAPARITVLGGPAAVSEPVVDELRTFADVRRAAGADRHATAAALAALVATPSVVYVATGAAFADALAGGAAAAAEGGVLLLTAADSLPTVTADAIRDIAPARIVVLGGTGAISPAVEEQLVALDAGDVSRIAGADRYATAAAIAAAAFGDDVDVAFVATGSGFGDALAATPAAARTRSPLLLTEAGSLPAASRAALERWPLRRIVVVGGHAAVGPAVEDALAALL